MEADVMTVRPERKAPVPTNLTCPFVPAFGINSKICATNRASFLAASSPPIMRLSKSLSPAETAITATAAKKRALTNIVSKMKFSDGNSKEKIIKVLKNFLFNDQELKTV